MKETSLLNRQTTDQTYIECTTMHTKGVETISQVTDNQKDHLSSDQKAP
jgi:hypothetical protein